MLVCIGSPPIDTVTSCHDVFNLMCGAYTVCSWEGEGEEGKGEERKREDDKTPFA